MLEDLASSIAASWIVTCPPLGRPAAAPVTAQPDVEATAEFPYVCTCELLERQQTSTQQA